MCNRPPLVDNSQIQSATLHNPLPLYAHAYAWPFLFIWPVFFAVYLSEERYNTYIAGQEWTFVWAGSIITLQSLAWLSTKWNVNIDAIFTTTRARDVPNAGLIKVIPVTNAGSAEICSLERDKVHFLLRRPGWVVANAMYRAGARMISRSYSRKDDFFTTMTRIVLHHFPTRWMLSRSLSFGRFRIRMV